MFEQELEDMRQQSEIWKNSSNSAAEKVKAENALLNEQLAQRNNDLNSLRQRVTELESERDRAMQVLSESEVTCLAWCINNSSGW